MTPDEHLNQAATILVKRRGSGDDVAAIKDAVTAHAHIAYAIARRSEELEQLQLKIDAIRHVCRQAMTRPAPLRPSDDPWKAAAEDDMRLKTIQELAEEIRDIIG